LGLLWRTGHRSSGPWAEMHKDYGGWRVWLLWDLKENIFVRLSHLHVALVKTEIN